MGKIFKPLAIVAAIAVNVIPGVGQVLSAAMISSITMMGVTAAIGMAAGALGLGPKKSGVSSAQQQRTTASIDPATPRKWIFGYTAFATDVRFEDWSGSGQEYFDRVMLAASHKGQITEIWFDKELAWSAAGGVAGKFAGYLTVNVRNEGSAANVLNLAGTKYGANRRFTGMAYVHLRYKVTGNGKKGESPFAQGITSKIVIRGYGSPVYDPRLDSTQPGGSGPQRANDQSTWAYNPGQDQGRNPALQLLTYLLGYRINGKLALGRGIPADRLDIASFMLAANACDEPVALASGGTEPRYRADGLVSEADDPSGVFTVFNNSMNGLLRDAAGRLSLTVIKNDLGTPRADFGDDDILGDFQWQQTPSLDQSFNEVRGRYTAPGNESLYELLPYPTQRIDSLDGIDRAHPLDLPLVQSHTQAQRLAKQQLQRAQYRGLFTCELGHRGYLVQLGDPVRLTFSALGWQNKLFRVVEHTIRQDGVVPVTLQEEHPSIYAWDASELAPVQPTAPTVYDWQNSPLIQAVEEAGGTADWPLVGDSQGTKPDDNATVGAPNGTPVGGRLSQDVVSIQDSHSAAIVSLDAEAAAQGLTLDQILVDVGDLETTYGSTASAAASASAAAGSASAAELAKQNAETARSQANDARALADQARSDAVAAKALAEGASSIASGHASVAQGHAGAASTSAGQALQYRNDAQGAQSQAATSASTSALAASDAAAAAGLTFPTDPTNNQHFYADHWQGTASVVNGARRWVANGPGLGAYGFIWPLNAVKPIAGRRYRFTGEGRGIPGTGAGTAGMNVDLWTPQKQRSAPADVGSWGYIGAATPVQQANWTAANQVWSSHIVEWLAPNNPPAFVTPRFYAFNEGVAYEMRSLKVEDVTESTLASGSAGAAALSASNAAASYGLADQRASAAQQSETNANTYQGQAKTYRDEASQSKLDAAGSASTASTQAALSATSSTAALRGASVARPATLDSTGTGFVGYDSIYSISDANSISQAKILSDENGFYYASGAQYDPLLQRAPFSLENGHTYEVEAQWKVASLPAGGTYHLVGFGLAGYTSAGAWGYHQVGTWWDAYYAAQIPSPVVTAKLKFKKNASSAEQSAGILNVDGATAPPLFRPYAWHTGDGDGKGVRYYSIRLTDVTARDAAAASAAAAVISASTASTKADEAGISAQSATTARNQAEGFSNTASTKADAASSSAAAASSSAASAASSVTLSASISMRAVPGDFRDKGRYWSKEYLPANQPAPAGPSDIPEFNWYENFGSWANEGVIVRLLGSGGYLGGIFGRAALPLVAGRTYRLTLRSYSNAGSVRPYFAFHSLAGTSAGYGYTGWQVRSQPAGSWQNLSITYRHGVDTPQYANAAASLIYPALDNPSPGNELWVSLLKLEDITEVAALEASQATLAASVSSQAAAIVTLQGRALAYWQQTVNAGAAGAFIEARAEATFGGGASSQVSIGARQVHIFNEVAGLWKRTIAISGGDVVIAGNLTAEAGIFLGSGSLWRVAYASKDFAVADGQAVSFGVNLGNVPKFEFRADNLAPLNSGETYKLFADSPTATGFTARLRIITPGTTASYNLTVDSAPGNGPTRQIEKAPNPDANGNTYNLAFSGSYTDYAYGSGGGGPRELFLPEN